jgi:hypothetical protein
MRRTLPSQLTNVKVSKHEMFCFLAEESLFCAPALRHNPATPDSADLIAIAIALKP